MALCILYDIGWYCIYTCIYNIIQCEDSTCSTSIFIRGDLRCSTTWRWPKRPTHVFHSQTAIWAITHSHVKMSRHHFAPAFAFWSTVRCASTSVSWYIGAAEFRLLVSHGSCLRWLGTKWMVTNAVFEWTCSFNLHCSSNQSEWHPCKQPCLREWRLRRQLGCSFTGTSCWWRERKPMVVSSVWQRWLEGEPRSWMDMHAMWQWYLLWRLHLHDLHHTCWQLEVCSKCHT